MAVILPKKVSSLDRYKTVNQVLHNITQYYRAINEKNIEDAKEGKKGDSKEALNAIARRSAKAIEYHKEHWNGINFDDYTVDKTLQPLTKFPDNGESETKTMKSKKTLEEF